MEDVEWSAPQPSKRASDVIDLADDGGEGAPEAPKRRRATKVVARAPATPLPLGLPPVVRAGGQPLVPGRCALLEALDEGVLTATDDESLVWPEGTPIPCAHAQGGIYHEKQGKLKARRVVSVVSRLVGHRTLTLRVDDAAALAHALSGAEKWQRPVEYRLMDGAVALDGLLRSGAIAASEEDAAFVEALGGLNDRDNDFKERCVHAVAFFAAAPAAKNAKNADPHLVPSVEAHVFVWARRVLFGLSAHPAVQALLDGVVAAGRVCARRAPLATDRSFSRSAAPNSAFTIKALLRTAESPGLSVPPGFSNAYGGLLSGVELRPYQLQNLVWAMHQEDRAEAEGTSVAGLNGYYWEKREFAGGAGDSFYYFPHGGHVLLEKPPVVSGGLLADEMGYGKTVSMLALVAADAAAHPRLPGEAGTLIVVPRSLFGQWAKECADKAPQFKVLQLEAAGGLAIYSAADLCVYDVVLLRHDQLARARLGADWRRVCVDECQFAANDTAQLASSLAKVRAKHVWMLSGTPITTKIEDFQGELSLLRIWPFTLGAGADAGWQSHFWDSELKEPWQRKDARCLPAFASLVRGTMMRHSREQVSVADNEPLVPLPALHVQWVGVDQRPASAERHVNLRIELLSTASGAPGHRFLPCLQRAASFAGATAVLEAAHKNTARGRTTGMRTTRGAALAAAATAAPRLDIARRLSVAAAIADVEATPALNAQRALVELRRVEACAGGLDACSVCLAAKRTPVYLPCRHSACLDCVRHLAHTQKKANQPATALPGAFACPECQAATCTAECFLLEVPENEDEIAAATAASAAAAAAAAAPADDDVDMAQGPPVGTSELRLASGAALKVAHTEADLDRDWLAFVKGPQTALETCHAAARSEGASGSAKLSAVLRLLAAHKAADITTQTVIVSQYADVLDELADSLDIVRYVLDVDMSGRDGVTLPVGARVRCAEGAATIVACDTKRSCNACLRFWDVMPFPEHCPDCGYLCKEETCGHRHALPGPPPDEDDKRRCTACTSRRVLKEHKLRNATAHDFAGEEVPPLYLYTVRLGCGREVQNVDRGELEAVRVRTRVPGKLLRGPDSESCLTRGGHDNRFAVGDDVAAQRPGQGSAGALEVSERVDVVDGPSRGKSGTVVGVGAAESGETAYSVELRSAAGAASFWTSTETFARAQLDAKGDTTWRRGRVVSVEGGGATDAFSQTLGCIRLDSHALDRRSDCLDVFRSDPYTSVLLMTLHTAGVGLNITNANAVFLLEPFRYGAHEAQAVMRVHRIGQTRPVNVFKFFSRGTIDERLLRLRHKRSDLDAATADGDAGDPDADVELSEGDLDVVLGRKA